MNNIILAHMGRLAVFSVMKNHQMCHFITHKLVQFLIHIYHFGNSLVTALILAPTHVVANLFLMACFVIVLGPRLGYCSTPLPKKKRYKILDDF